MPDQCPTCSCETNGDHTCPHTKAPTTRELDARLADIARQVALDRMRAVDANSAHEKRLEALDAAHAALHGEHHTIVDRLEALERELGIAKAEWLGHDKRIGALERGRITLKSFERIVAASALPNHPDIGPEFLAQRLASGVPERPTTFLMDVGNEVAYVVRASDYDALESRLAETEAMLRVQRRARFAEGEDLMRAQDRVVALGMEVDALKTKLAECEGWTLHYQNEVADLTADRATLRTQLAYMARAAERWKENARTSDMYGRANSWVIDVCDEILSASRAGGKDTNAGTQGGEASNVQR